MTATSPVPQLGNSIEGLTEAGKESAQASAGDGVNAKHQELTDGVHIKVAELMDPPSPELQQVLKLYADAIAKDEAEFSQLEAIAATKSEQAIVAAGDRFLALFEVVVMPGGGNFNNDDKTFTVDPLIIPDEKTDWQAWSNYKCNVSENNILYAQFRNLIRKPEIGDEDSITLQTIVRKMLDRIKNKLTKRSRLLNYIQKNLHEKTEDVCNEKTREKLDRNAGEPEDSQIHVSLMMSLVPATLAGIKGYNNFHAYIRSIRNGVPNWVQEEQKSQKEEALENQEFGIVLEQRDLDSNQRQLQYLAWKEQLGRDLEQAIKECGYESADQFYTLFEQSQKALPDYDVKIGDFVVGLHRCSVQRQDFLKPIFAAMRKKGYPSTQLSG